MFFTAILSICYLCSFFDSSIAGELEQEDKVKILYFCADWCGPCQKLKQLFKDKDVEKELEKYDFNIYDYDSNKELAKKYGVTRIPSMIFERDKETIDKVTGYKNKSSLLEILKRNQ
tara:strand:- start:777 stop:1127 length:351 start_codon:yes stop_codon:yes gene_type:complete